MNWKRLSQTLALLAASLGALSFAGWTFGIDALTRLHPAWVTNSAGENIFAPWRSLAGK